MPDRDIEKAMSEQLDRFIRCLEAVKERLDRIEGTLDALDWRKTRRLDGTPRPNSELIYYGNAKKKKED